MSQPGQGSLEGQVPAGDPDRLLTLKQAVDLPRLNGLFSVKMLRTAIDKGKLPATQLGKRILVTEAGIVDWIRSGTIQPPVKPKTNDTPASPLSRLPEDEQKRIAVLSCRAVLADLRAKADAKNEIEKAARKEARALISQNRKAAK